MVTLSQEIIAVVIVGIGLAGLILQLGRRLEQRIDRIDARLLAVEKEQARTSGLLEGFGAHWARSRYTEGRTTPS